MTKLKLDMKVLPGEPLDGTGSICIHLLVRDQNGPISAPCVLDHFEGDKLVFTPAKMRVACDAKKTVAPVVHGGFVHITNRTDDPRAVTCPKCKATQEYRELMTMLEAASSA